MAAVVLLLRPAPRSWPARRATMFGIFLRIHSGVGEDLAIKDAALEGGEVSEGIRGELGSGG